MGISIAFSVVVIFELCLGLVISHRTSHHVGLTAAIFTILMQLSIFFCAISSKLTMIPASYRPYYMILPLSTVVASLVWIVVRIRLLGC